MAKFHAYTPILGLCPYSLELVLVTFTVNNNMMLQQRYEVMLYSIYREGKKLTTVVNLPREALTAGPSLYTVSQKTSKIIFVITSSNFHHLLTIFRAKRLKLNEVHSFSTSPNSCHHTTVLNADVPNCYITL